MMPETLLLVDIKRMHPLELPSACESATTCVGVRLDLQVLSFCPELSFYWKEFANWVIVGVAYARVNRMRMASKSLASV